MERVEPLLRRLGRVLSLVVARNCALRRERRNRRHQRRQRQQQPGSRTKDKGQRTKDTGKKTPRNNFLSPCEKTCMRCPTVTLFFFFSQELDSLTFLEECRQYNVMRFQIIISLLSYDSLLLSRTTRRTSCTATGDFDGCAAAVCLSRFESYSSREDNRTLRGHERDEVFQPTHRDMSVLSAWGRNR